MFKINAQDTNEGSKRNNDQRHQQDSFTCLLLCSQSFVSLKDNKTGRLPDGNYPDSGGTQHSQHNIRVVIRYQQYRELEESKYNNPKDQRSVDSDFFSLNSKENIFSKNNLGATESNFYQIHLNTIKKQFRLK